MTHFSLDFHDPRIGLTESPSSPEPVSGLIECFQDRKHSLEQGLNVYTAFSRHHCVKTVNLMAFFSKIGSMLVPGIVRQCIQ